MTPAAVRRSASTTTDAAQHLEDLVLSGPPSRLTAVVTVANTGDRALPVDGILVRRPNQLDLPGVAGAVVAPGETALVPVFLSVPPSTAPGNYPAEVEVGGVSRSVTLRVEAHLSVIVSPTNLVVPPGTHPLTLVLNNTGNVPLPLAELTRANTHDGGPDPGPDVSLRLASPPIVAPGQRAMVDATLEVPDLDPTRRHTARVPVGLSGLDIHILPRTPEEK